MSGAFQHRDDRDRGAGRAREFNICATVLLLLALFLVARSGATVHADEAIRVSDNSYAVKFAQNITFRLKAEAPAGIKAVTLYYRRVGEIVTVKVPLEVKPGQTTFSYTWEFEPGEVPLGARLEYEWRIVDGADNSLKTSPIAFSYEDDRFSWKTLQDENVVLFWYDSNEAQARRLLGYATQSLARLQDEMGIAPGRLVHIYVYESKSDMAAALPRQSEAFDNRILTLGVMVDDTTLLILGPHPEVQGTLSHELTHIAVGLATKNPYSPPPRWLDEGLAMYAEGKLPAGNRQALEDAVKRDALISVRSLSGYAGDPSEVNLFYGEVYSLVEFMLKTYGKDKMSQLLAAFREGLYQEDALRRVYGFGVDELDLQWRKSMGLGPRPTHVPGATPVPRRPATRPGTPCLSVLGLALLGVFILWRKGCARTA